MRRFGSEWHAGVFADNTVALSVEEAAAAVVGAARADIGCPSEENGSEVDPSPSVPGCTSKDLKESECDKVVKSGVKSADLSRPLIPAAKAAALTDISIPW